MSLSGIYAIYNTIEDKFYIGSSRNLAKRKTEHFSQLRHNKHKNKKLQEAFNKYGESSFEYSIVEYCSPKNLLSLEEFYIKEFNSFNSGYNNTDITSGSSMTLDIVRQKHWGVLHGGAKYSEDKILECFNLLGTTDFTYSKISELTGMHMSSVQYIADGGHEWAHIKFPEVSKKIFERVSRKEESGTVNDNETVITVMTYLLNTPNMAFSEISEATGVSTETISAISSGRQFKTLILESNLKDRAEEYYLLGKIEYSKKYSRSISKELAETISKCLTSVIESNTWYGRDYLSETYSLSTTVARKLTEFDIRIFNDLIYFGYGKLVSNYIKLRRTGKRAHKVKPELEIMLENIESQLSGNV